VWTDIVTGGEWVSLRHLAPQAVPEQARFQVIDSNLSEFGVLAFEYGYSLDTPDGLVLWEAQFGDFVNGAQVVIDQYLAAAEQKWGRLSGLVLLLPHGYEGQGPEHSSARLERFLQSCAEDNLVVANCTTPANYFHLLRRQVVRKVRKPVVLMTPKSLLRHAECVSPLHELVDGVFRRVIADPREIEGSDARRVIFTSGKVYYDLAEALRRSPHAERILVHRVEQLYPFPAHDVRMLVDDSPEAEVVWAQEEPANMGAWPSVQAWLADALPADRPVRYVGRPAAASPATGSHHKHKDEQAALVAAALALT
jgi:2-oxoglutarate dehydrogenase E1 component